jgi:hypothetical protein
MLYSKNRITNIERVRQFPAPNRRHNTPRKLANLSWIIAGRRRSNENRSGPNINLGNIAPDDVIPLETLRCGLRADTFATFAPKAEGLPLSIPV